MSQSNFSPIFLTVALAAATTPFIPNNIDKGSFPYRDSREASELSYKSGRPLAFFYAHPSEVYVKTQQDADKINDLSIAMQKRFLSMQHSFVQNNEGFTIEKQSYFALMTNALCKLDFGDNVTSYNRCDDSIDVVLWLSSGLKLSVSCFTDEDLDAPMVFSLHRGHTLLVSDELPVNEIVRTIKSVIV